MIWVVLGALLAVGSESCTARAGLSHIAAKSTATLSTPSSLSPRTPTSPVTEPSLVTPPTITNVYPSPYDPGYTTIEQLVNDSTFIVRGSLEAGSPIVDANGTTVMAYPISVQESFKVNPPVTLSVLQNEVTAAKLSVGSTYIFFWAASDNTTGSETTAVQDTKICIVGGVRGVMAYDAATDTVTRLDHSSNSQIPQSQTLEQFAAAVENAIPIGAQPISTTAPPVCAPSATGLPGS